MCTYSCIKYGNVSLLITMDKFWINFILGSIFLFSFVFVHGIKCMIISIKQRKQKLEPQEIHDCIQLGKLYVHSPNGFVCIRKIQVSCEKFHGIPLQSTA